MKVPQLKLTKSLTESPLSRYFSFSALYIAQGIPEGIIYYALPAWLAMNGKPALEIAAIISVCLIPWSFKLLIAPLMDRFTILSMGRKRPWVIFGQLGLILSFLSIAFVPDPLNNNLGLMVIGFMINFFGAFQDVATDGMAVDVIPKNDQAKTNGLMWGAKIIGTSLSLVIGTYLINTLGFTTAISLLSIAVALIILVPLYFTERPGEKTLPWTSGEIHEESKTNQLQSWSQIIKNLFRVTKLSASVYFIIASFIVGIMFGLLDTLFPIFTVQELGWTNAEFSESFSSINIITGIIGMIIGGYLVDKFGKLKMITLYVGLIVMIICLFAFSSTYWKSTLVIFGFIFAYYTLYMFLSIAVFASGMHLCWKTVAATQFTVYMAVCNFGRSVGTALLGVLETNYSWEHVFLITASIPLAMGIVIQFINFKKHRDIVDKFVILKQPLAAPRVIQD